MCLGWCFILVILLIDFGVSFAFFFGLIAWCLVVSVGCVLCYCIIWLFICWIGFWLFDLLLLDLLAVWARCGLILLIGLLLKMVGGGLWVILIRFTCGLVLLGFYWFDFSGFRFGVCLIGCLGLDWSWVNCFLACFGVDFKFVCLLYFVI